MDGTKGLKTFFLKNNSPAGDIENISKKIKEEYGPLTTYHWKTATSQKIDKSWSDSELDLYDIVRKLIESRNYK